MGKKNRGAKTFSGVNPQGYSTGVERAKQPASQLENAAKKNNTKS